MLHAQNEDIASLVERMCQQISGCDYLILDSLQEYKKTSPEYF
jgi:hypothetical protein